ncbi:MAG: hypothetical protein AAF362_12880 [Pseudomonadota bacterium]
MGLGLQIRHLALIVGVGAGLALAPKIATAQDAIQAPGSKQIGTPSTEQAGIVPSLFVLNAQNATLAGDTLTLNGVPPSLIIFADRPVRAAGHELTEHFVADWGEGEDSFASNPPNATVSVFDKEGSTVKDVVVVLKSPQLSGDTLTFNVDVIDGDLENADGPASVFIDIIGMPLTPYSYAGAARRAMRRGAFYAGAAAGAAAAYRHPYMNPYYHPYYRPYYRRPCGRYPYPPCPLY